MTGSERTTNAVLDEVRKRKTPNPYLDEEVVDFLEWCVAKIQEDKREATVGTVKDYLGLYGPARFGGFHEFISDCWMQCGSDVDIENFLRNRGLVTAVPTTKPKATKSEEQEPTAIKAPAMQF